MELEFFYLLGYSILLVSTFTLFLLTLSKRREKKALFFALGLSHQFIWIFAFIMGLIDSDIVNKLYWDNFINWGMFGYLLFYIVFSMLFFGYSFEKYKKWYYMFVFCGFVLLIPMFIIPDHPVMRFNIWVDNVSNFSIIRYTNGPYLWFVTIFGFILLGFLIASFIIFIFKSKDKVRKSQALLILIALSIPTFASITMIFGSELGIFSHIVNLFLIAFVISSVIIYNGIIRMQTLEILPVAKDNILEYSPDGVCIFDLNHNLVEINRNMLALLDHPSKKTILHKSFPDVFQRWKNLQSILHNEILEKIEITTVTVGDMKHYDVKKIPLKDEMQRVLGFLLIFQDITMRKTWESKLIQSKDELEEKFRQAQKMESIGRLAGGIAHDINNILTIIIGNAQLLLENLQPNDENVTSLNEVLTAAESASKLTKQLLAFSRKQVLKPEIFNLNWLIDRIKNILSRTIREDIRVKINLENPVSSIKADVSAMEQVIMNLAINAQDAMPNGGTLYIATKEIENDLQVKYVQLTVSDTGLGMSNEIKAHLFEPFFTTKPKGEGTGLGLATVYGTIAQFGGYIEVQSELGQGTTFLIYLPICLSENTHPVLELSSTVEMGHQEFILFVEDDANVQKITSDLLKKLNYIPIVFTSGEAVIEYFPSIQEKIDLLFTDIILPKMNGKDLYDQLKTRLPTLKVLFGSGYTDNILNSYGLSADKINFISKPYTLESLAIHIHHALYPNPP